MASPPKAILFDIGGVVVRSPMQAIHDYESAHGIPHNWVNFAIARSSARPNGAWQRAETGAMPLDETFFDAFREDLHDYSAWRDYCEQLRKKSFPSSESLTAIPPLPRMDTTTLFWAMMIISRTADPAMSAALTALKASERFVIGALSNTIAFPSWHPFATVVEDDVRTRFDIFVSSAHVGVRKPHREAFDLAVQELDAFARKNGKGGIEAKDVLFLDDIGQNLRTARELGLRTIKVNLGKTEEAVREMESITGMNLSGRASRL